MLDGECNYLRRWRALRIVVGLRQWDCEPERSIFLSNRKYPAVNALWNHFTFGLDFFTNRGTISMMACVHRKERFDKAISLKKYLSYPLDF